MICKSRCVRGPADSVLMICLALSQECESTQNNNAQLQRRMSIVVVASSVHSHHPWLLAHENATRRLHWITLDIQYSTSYKHVQYSSVQYSTVQYSTVGICVMFHFPTSSQICDPKTASDYSTVVLDACARRLK